MSIADDLRDELDILIQMMPIWRTHEEVARRYFTATGSPSDLATYVEAYTQLMVGIDKLDFINKLLRDNPGE